MREGDRWHRAQLFVDFLAPPSRLSPGQFWVGDTATVRGRATANYSKRDTWDMSREQGQLALNRNGDRRVLAL